MRELLDSPLDLAALGFFLLMMAGFRIVSAIPGVRRRSLVHWSQAHRTQWMRNMIGRDNRVLDTILLGGLGQGNAFFASTSAIALGGLAAVLGSGDKLKAVLEHFPWVARAPTVIWEVKVVFLMLIVIYAFFKFAWAFRLTHYCAILIGATPLSTDVTDTASIAHADRTARLIGIAADHANSGLRAFYYAMAGIAWFFHPLLFMAATVWVLAILIRRDYFSRSLAVLKEGAVETAAAARGTRGAGAAVAPAQSSSSAGSL